MKKTLSLCLATIMILLCIPIHVSATEDSTNDRQEIISLACEVFPEYSNKICKNNNSRSMNNAIESERELIFTEIRNVTEDEYMMYSEYSDGIVLLTNYAFDYDILSENISTGAGATEVTMSLKATCAEDGYNGVFYLDNFRYVFNSYTYDRIISLGTTRAVGSCKLTENDDMTGYENPRYSLYETSSQKAYAEYYLNFWPGSSGYFTFNSCLDIRVGNNGCTISHYDVG